MYKLMERTLCSRTVVRHQAASVNLRALPYGILCFVRLLILSLYDLDQLQMKHNFVLTVCLT